MTADYLRSAEFLDWIDSYPATGMYDWVAGADGGFPRLSVELAVRTWEDVAEAVTEQDGVYDIYTPQQLAYIASLVNGGRTLSGKTIRLQADIDLSGLYWIPMGELYADLDGNGHTISGLRVGNEDFPCRDYAGLIGYMYGSVSGLTVDGNVIATGCAGLLAAYSDAGLSDCHGSGSVSGGYDTGGLVGNGYSSFSRCSFSGTVTGGDNVGGITGENHWGSFSECYATGTVTGQGNVGGVCGNGNSTIENCYSVCEIVNSGSNSGGLIGYCGTGRNITVRNCYAAGSVTGAGNVGALFGSIDIDNCSAENCYFNKNGGYVIGGLSITPRACGSGTLNSGVTALTAEQMRQQSSFVGFDFAEIWAIDPAVNDGMPYLQWETASTAGHTVTLDDYTKGKATITGLVDGNTYAGNTEFTVTSDFACLVLYSADGGQTYTRLTAAGSGNTYSFTVDVDQDLTVVVAIKGDVTLDGELKNQDVTIMKAAYLGKRTVSSLQLMVADVNVDGNLKNQDGTKTKAAFLGKTSLSWDI